VRGESGVDLFFADLPTRDPDRAFDRVEQATEPGARWKAVYAVLAAVNEFRRETRNPGQAAVESSTMVEGERKDN
jgi:hypothetical protein